MHSIAEGVQSGCLPHPVMPTHDLEFVAIGDASHDDNSASGIRQCTTVSKSGPHETPVGTKTPESHPAVTSVVDSVECCRDR